MTLRANSSPQFPHTIGLNEYKGVSIARCTVERLMRKLGLHGVMRGKVVRTTIGDAKAACPLDRVNRQFRAQRPNQLSPPDEYSPFPPVEYSPV